MHGRSSPFAAMPVEVEIDYHDGRGPIRLRFENADKVEVSTEPPEPEKADDQSRE